MNLAENSFFEFLMKLIFFSTILWKNTKEMYFLTQIIELSYKTRYVR
jgi:hypothetical protein